MYSEFCLEWKCDLIIVIVGFGKLQEIKFCFFKDVFDIVGYMNKYYLGVYLGFFKEQEGYSYELSFYIYCKFISLFLLKEWLLLYINKNMRMDLKSFRKQNKNLL